MSYKPCRIASSNEGTSYCETCEVTAQLGIACEREAIARMLEARATEICHLDQCAFDTMEARVAIEISELARRVRDDT